jgi:quinol monooxygenase YgiN
MNRRDFSLAARRALSPPEPPSLKAPPMPTVTLQGTLACATPQDAALVARLLSDHVRLSRAEPGCLLFEVTQTAYPLVWQVAETFTDRAAFDAHQTRSRASVWGQSTAHIARSYTVAEA